MHDINILIKPASGSCNMRCRYCFYADEMGKRSGGNAGMMSLETAENIIKRAFDYSDAQCTFAFQGGEPTLRGLDFFRHFVSCADERRGKRQIHYALQTNGLLIDSEWAEFLAAHDFLVGLSVDGTREVHDLNRVDAAGDGTHSRVLAAARELKKHRVKFNVLTVLTSRAAKSIESVYNFYKKNELLYQQYIPCLEPIFEQQGTDAFSLTPELYARGMKRLFDLWYEDRAAGRFIYLHNFEALAGNMLGAAPAGCGISGICSVQNVIEADGTVYPCDFYALDDYAIGNVNTQSFEEMDIKRRPFLEASRQGLEECRHCPYYLPCRGGCRRDRQYEDHIGLNRLCPGYKEFYAYAIPKLTRLLRSSGYRT